jgi:alkylhydroperoxidase/carboxymuconolactone decarboxylase family protein YurZ
MPKQPAAGRVTDAQRELLLIVVATIAALERDAGAELHAYVDAAIDAGATWQQVAAALGVTRSAAHQRFHR